MIIQPLISHRSHMPTLAHGDMRGYNGAILISNLAIPLCLVRLKRGSKRSKKKNILLIYNVFFDKIDGQPEPRWFCKVSHNV